MLVLTRRPNESIMIGDDVEVSILCVNGDKVKIGIRAPYEVPLLRTEIYVAPEHRSRDRIDRVAH